LAIVGGAAEATDRERNRHSPAKAFIGCISTPYLPACWR